MTSLTDKCFYWLQSKSPYDYRNPTIGKWSAEDGYFMVVGWDVGIPPEDFDIISEIKR